MAVAGYATAKMNLTGKSCFPVATLRVSVTDRCNLRCAYCMPADGVPLVARDSMLRLEELADNVAWIHQRKPLRKIKITGGEPLVRRGLASFVAFLAALEDRPEISMTSNGTLLGDHAAELCEAGLQRVNISLDTLNPKRYRVLTRGGRVEPVVASLESARIAGLHPIKINSVLRRSSFMVDIPELLDFAAEQGLVVRFLELMRTGTERQWSENELVAAHEVRQWMKSISGCNFPDDQLEQGADPARLENILWRGEELQIGWILPQSDPFCDACDRLRIDARGRLRRCLMDSKTFDLAKAQMSGDDAEVLFEDFLAGKRPPQSMDNALPMASLGG